MTTVYSDRLSMRDIIGGIKRKMPHIVACYMIFLIMGFVLSYFIPSKFESYALIKIEVPNILLDGKSKETIKSNISIPQDTIIQNEIQILKSYDLLKSVIDKLGLTKSVTHMQHSLDIKPIHRSSILRVTYQDSNAINVQRTLQEIINHYQKNQITLKKEHIIRTNEWLSERLQVLSQKSESAHAKIEHYLESNKDKTIDPQQIDADIQELHTKLRTIKEKELHTLSLLENQENVLLVKLADLRGRYGPKHPKMQSVQLELSVIKNKINDIKEASKMDFNENTKKNNETYAQTHNELDRLYALKNHHSTDLVQLRILEKEAEATQKMYDDFVDRYTESSEGSLYQTPDHVIITMPTRALNSTQLPRSIIIVFITSILMMILIMAIALYAYTFPRIRSSEHIHNIDPSYSVIAMIPHTYDRKNIHLFINAIRQTIENIKKSPEQEINIGLISAYNDDNTSFLQDVLSEYAIIHIFNLATYTFEDISLLKRMDLNLCVLKWDSISPDDFRYIITQIKLFKIPHIQFVIHHVITRIHLAYGYSDMITFNNRDTK